VAIDPESPRHPTYGSLLHESARGRELVEIVGHALERMKCRSITEHDILCTLREGVASPDQTQPGRLRFTWHRTRKIKIDVVFEELPDRVRVITVIRADAAPAIRPNRKGRRQP
jgi:hypothetical protein